MGWTLQAWCMQCLSGAFLRADWSVCLQEIVAEETAGPAGDVGCVLCLGHNKGMEEAASSLAVCCHHLHPMCGLLQKSARCSLPFVAGEHGCEATAAPAGAAGAAGDGECSAARGRC